MRRCTLEEVARFCGGQLIKGDPTIEVDRIHTDTRTQTKVDCLLAMQGDLFHGHEFVREVKARGAVAALVSESSSLICQRISAGRSARYAGSFATFCG